MWSVLITGDLPKPNTGTNTGTGGMEMGNGKRTTGDWILEVQIKVEWECRDVHSYTVSAGNKGAVRVLRQRDTRVWKYREQSRHSDDEFLGAS